MRSAFTSGRKSYSAFECTSNSPPQIPRTRKLTVGVLLAPETNPLIILIRPHFLPLYSMTVDFATEDQTTQLCGIFDKFTHGLQTSTALGQTYTVCCTFIPCPGVGQRKHSTNGQIVRKGVVTFSLSTILW